MKIRMRSEIFAQCFPLLVCISTATQPASSQTPPSPLPPEPGRPEPARAWLAPSPDDGKLLPIAKPGEPLSIRWNFHLQEVEIPSDGKSLQEGYAWMSSPHLPHQSSGLPGNTAPTGIFRWTVPKLACGVSKISVRVCCGRPPRQSKFLCQTTQEVAVQHEGAEGTSGGCSLQGGGVGGADGVDDGTHDLSDRRRFEGKAPAMVREMGPLPLVKLLKRREKIIPPPSEASPASSVFNRDSDFHAAPETRPFSLALITLWLGPLPKTLTRLFIFSASAQPDTTFFIFHSEPEDLSELLGDSPQGGSATVPAPRDDGAVVPGTTAPLLPPNVRFQHLPPSHIGKRLWALPKLREQLSRATAFVTIKSEQEAMALAEEIFAADNGQKANDLKPFFGALFEAELGGVTHWGWTDLDVVWGDVGGAVREALSVDSPLGDSTGAAGDEEEV